MLSLAIVILCFAIINTCIVLLLRKFKIINEDKLVIDLENSIFVCIVSYKDPKWIESVISILNTAYEKNRVFIGVVEYVDNKSMIDVVPQNIRNQIRIKTLSYKSATTLCEARKICMNTLFYNEKYVLFTRAINLYESWDTILTSYIKNRNIVISTLLINDPINIFTTITSINKNNISIGYKELFATSNEPIKSIVWCPDLYFCLSSIYIHTLHDETSLGVSAYLYHKKIKIYNPGQCIGTKGKHPRGIRQKNTCVLKYDLIKSYCEYLGINIENQNISPYLKCGLNKNAKADECISKYGSVSQSNIVVENSG